MHEGGCFDLQYQTVPELYMYTKVDANLHIPVCQVRFAVDTFDTILISLKKRCMSFFGSWHTSNSVLLPDPLVASETYSQALSASVVPLLGQLLVSVALLDVNERSVSCCEK